MIENKNTQDKKNILGQFLTPDFISQQFVNSANFENIDIVIEPSCGKGAFTSFLQEIKDKDVIGYEIDPVFTREAIASIKNDRVKILNKNFYDIKELPSQYNKVYFIGNPPYRTPAYSLSTHTDHIGFLCKNFNVKGCREEAVFFILHTVWLSQKTKYVRAKLDYIVPAIIIKSTTKVANSVRTFLQTQCFNVMIDSVPNSFNGVSQELVRLRADINPTLVTESAHFINETDQQAISYQDIFIKTSLGSVPCESFLVSVKNESKCHFKNRIISLISRQDYKIKDMYPLLTFQNQAYLSVLNRAIDKQNKQFNETATKKLQQIIEYLNSIHSTKIDLTIFKDINNYKAITGRHKELFYFRHPSLKKCSFVYELNPNPGKSFYFTGNPSHSSTDYFGFCAHDILRNTSPGACRTVLLDKNLKAVFTKRFQEHWYSSTKCNIKKAFQYFQYIATTEWYKNRKRQEKRFYFGVPIQFDNLFYESVFYRDG